LCAARCASSTAAAIIHATANSTTLELELDVEWALRRNPYAGKKLKSWCQQHGGWVRCLISPLQSNKKTVHYLSSCTRLTELKFTLLSGQTLKPPVQAAVVALRDLERLTLQSYVPAECDVLSSLTRLTHLRLFYMAKGYGLNPNTTLVKMLRKLPSLLQSLEVIARVQPGELELHTYQLPALTHLLVCNLDGCVSSTQALDLQSYQAPCAVWTSRSCQ